MENDLKFTGAAPLIIDFNGSTDDIYAPVVTTSYDVNVVSENILDDLYTAEKDDIAVKITESKPVYVDEILVESWGSINTQSYQGDISDGFSVGDNFQFFTDINGDYFFHGEIKDSGLAQNVNLKYDRSNNTWIYLNDDEGWKMTEFYEDGWEWQYFTDGIDSYKVRVSDTASQSTPTYYLIWDATNNEWSETQYNYSKLENGSLSPMHYSCEYINHYDDGELELLYTNKRYLWNQTNKVWERITSYVLTSGESYSSIHKLFKVKNQNGNLIDAVYVSISTNDNWLCLLNKENGTITKMIKLPDGVGPEYCFTDDYGTFYVTIKSDRPVYIGVWSWKDETFIPWIKFEETGYLDNIVDLFVLFEVPAKGTYSKRVSLSFLGNRRCSLLYDIVPPEISYIRVLDHYEDLASYGGYVTPNMYSQDMTLNLDQIEISCIDYIAIMKYVTVDKIFDNSGIMTYGDIISDIIAYVFKKPAQLLVDTCVSYGGDYDGTNGILEFRCQMANFWDEADEASTAYEVIEELLRPFCMRLYYLKDNIFVLYNINNLSTTGRTFNSFIINEDGTMSVDEDADSDTCTLCMERIMTEDIISNNVSVPSLEIRNTYDEVTAVASTCVPVYSKMAIDMIDPSQRDKYAYGGLNVQTNKTKGYQKVTRYIRPDRDRWIPITVVEPVTDDKWFYLWNGVWCDPEYHLNPESVGVDVNWHLNINKAYEYLTGTAGSPDDYGSILNFFGGSSNPTGTGKEQYPEKAVEISKKITAYAPDDGVPLEFLELSNLHWDLGYGGPVGYNLTKRQEDMEDAAWGTAHTMGQSNRIIYHQKYENIQLSSLQDHILEFNLAQSFSRTGTDTKITVMNNNTATNKTYQPGGRLQHAESDYFPKMWNSEEVTVNSLYFRRYASDGAGSTCTPVWDSTRVDIYVKLSDDTYMQFDGNEWRACTSDHEYGFYLEKLMNEEQLYHTEMRYNIIVPYVTNSATRQRYALSDEDIYVHYDRHGGVTDRETNNYDQYTPYKDKNVEALHSCSEGQLSIKLPYIDDLAATVYVDVYNSSMLGMTGLDNPIFTNDTGMAETLYYTTDDQEVSQNFQEATTLVKFVPVNTSYIKGEHINLSLAVTVPESNLGQMFDQSDIKYTVKSDKNYVEKYNMKDFRLNTQNNFVLSSNSYLLFNNELADPGEFIINGISGRPEAYTVQAYYNWLTNIRRIFNKTVKSVVEDAPLLPSDFINDRMRFIRTPEYPDTDYLVVANSWDVKTDRHTFTAIESDDLEVDHINQVLTEEIPRKARAERFNLPTSTRKRIR